MNYAIQKFIGGICRQQGDHRQKGDVISLLLFFKIRKVSYKGSEESEVKYSDSIGSSIRR
jgi:hypothetical protein